MLWCIVCFMSGVIYMQSEQHEGKMKLLGLVVSAVTFLIAQYNVFKIETRHD